MAEVGFESRAFPGAVLPVKGSLSLSLAGSLILEGEKALPGPTEVWGMVEIGKLRGLLEKSNLGGAFGHTELWIRQLGDSQVVGTKQATLSTLNVKQWGDLMSEHKTSLSTRIPQHRVFCPFGRPLQLGRLQVLGNVPYWSGYKCGVFFFSSKHLKLRRCFLPLQYQ